MKKLGRIILIPPTGKNPANYEARVHPHFRDFAALFGLTYSQERIELTVIPARNLDDGHPVGLVYQFEGRETFQDYRQLLRGFAGFFCTLHIFATCLYDPYPYKLKVY